MEGIHDHFGDAQDRDVKKLKQNHEELCKKVTSKDMMNTTEEKSTKPKVVEEHKTNSRQNHFEKKMDVRTDQSIDPSINGTEDEGVVSTAKKTEEDEKAIEANLEDIEASSDAKNNRANFLLFGTEADDRDSLVQRDIKRVVEDKQAGPESGNYQNVEGVKNAQNEMEEELGHGMNVTDAGDSAALTNEAKEDITKAGEGSDTAIIIDDDEEQQTEKEFPMALLEGEDDPAGDFDDQLVEDTLVCWALVLRVCTMVSLVPMNLQRFIRKFSDACVLSLFFGGIFLLAVSRLEAIPSKVS